MADIVLAAAYFDAITEDSPGGLAVINRDPSPGESGVPSTWDIALELVDLTALNPGVDLAATFVYVGGVLAYDGSTGLFQSGFDGPGSSAGPVAIGSSDMRIVVDQTTPFDSLEIVAVRVVSDLVGAGFAIDEVWSFTAEDTEAPSLVSALAISQTQIELTFNEDVEEVSIALLGLAPQSFPAVTPLAVSASISGAVVLIELDREFSPGIEYALSLGGSLSDTSGNLATESTTITGFVPQAPDPRRSFDLLSMLPPRMVAADETGDLRDFIALFQEIVDSQILPLLDSLRSVNDLETAPEGVIDLMLIDLGNPFDFELSEAKKRKLVDTLVELYQQSGTALGIENAIRFFVGVEASVLPYNGTGWQLDVDSLDIDAVLGPDAQRDLYSFRVAVEIALDDEQRTQINAIVEQMKPSHTHFVRLDENAPPTVWILGVSTLGTNTTLS